MKPRVQEIIESTRQRLRQRPFRPHLLLPGAHAQTMIVSRVGRRFPWSQVEWNEDHIELENEIRVRVVSLAGEALQPTLIVIHGMSGDSQSGYMQALAHKTHRLGWTCHLPELYDVGRRSPAAIFHAGASQGTGQLIEALVQRHHPTTVFLVGVSMGGNILLKLLAEWRDRTLPWLKAAAVYSPLTDLTESWRLLEKPSNRLYQYHFVRRLKAIMIERRDRLDDALDWQAFERIRTVRDFDDVVTAPLAGYRDAFDYYRNVSSAPRLGEIRTPVLAIHSRDDPFLNWMPLATPEATHNPSLLVHLTRRGGHVGFLERQALGDLDRFWAENRVIEFLQAFQESASDPHPNDQPSQA